MKYCPKCGFEVKDLKFCPICGCDVDGFGSTESYYTKAEKKKKKTLIASAAIVILGLTVAIVAMVDSSASPAPAPTQAPATNIVEEPVTEPDLVPVEEPESGEILSGEGSAYGSELTITASQQACVVKLKDSEGNDVMSFYVQGDDTVTVGVPARYLQVFFASGDTWYGETELFGDSTSYSKDDEFIDFASYTCSYTLHPVTGGNYSETPIDESEF